MRSKLLTSFALALCLAQSAHSLTLDKRKTQFNREADLINYLNRDAPDLVNTPNDGLTELNQKLYRFHEFQDRYLERDELDMLFIEKHLKKRAPHSAVVLVSEKVAVLVWLDERTKQAKFVSSFFGRNLYRIRQIGHDVGLIVREVGPSFENPEREVSADKRTPANQKSPFQNAGNYAEELAAEASRKTKPKLKTTPNYQAPQRITVFR